MAPARLPLLILSLATTWRRPSPTSHDVFSPRTGYLRGVIWSWCLSLGIIWNQCVLIESREALLFFILLNFSFFSTSTKADEPTDLTRVPQSKRSKVILGDTPVAVFVALKQAITSSPLSTPSSSPIAAAATSASSTEATTSSSAATSHLTTLTNTAASSSSTTTTDTAASSFSMNTTNVTVSSSSTNGAAADIDDNEIEVQFVASSVIPNSSPERSNYIAKANSLSLIMDDRLTGLAFRQRTFKF
ncbi:hypothetical protein EV360DRAFT_88804 [Lentinula raphanica]|nr:hypothetical protein EV360DRAFT_88804 [Lentinula raphanica]